MTDPAAPHPSCPAAHSESNTLQMESNSSTIKLYYNTELEKLKMPEYGRGILEMIDRLKSIPDKAKRSEQARAVVKSMEILNSQVHQQDNWEQKLWDHLYMIAGEDLDIDSPYPAPEPSFMETRPLPIPTGMKPLKATHYGRNIESIIELIASEPDGEPKTAMIRSLAIYMRQQYLIWNKDSVADETIFNDIEKLSDYRIKVPEDIVLTKISTGANFSRPGIGIKPSNNGKKRRNNWKNKRK